MNESMPVSGAFAALKLQLDRLSSTSLTFTSKVKYLAARILSARMPSALPHLPGTITLEFLSGSKATLRLATSDIYIFDEIFVRGDYVAIMALLPLQPASPMRIMDLGSNVGFAGISFKERFPAAELICVEPQEDNFRLLASNLSQYPAETVHLRRGFVGGDAGTAVIADESAVACGFQMERVSSAPEGSAAVLPVLQVDTLMNSAGWAKIDLLKCDIEGAEAELFCEPKPWHSSVLAMIIELHAPYLLDRFRNDLAKLPGNWQICSAQESAFETVLCAVSHSA